MFIKAPRAKKDTRLVRYTTIIVHCAATTPDMFVDAAWVDKEHRKRGFKNGCGYHAVINSRGEWEDADDGYPTRLIGGAGAHVGDCGAGWNGLCFGICLAGGISRDGQPEPNYTDIQLDTLEEGIKRFLSLHPDPDNVTLLGHRDLIRRTGAPPKACPCFDVRSWWKNRDNPDMPASSTSAQRVIIPFPIPSSDDSDISRTLRTKSLSYEYHRIEKGDTLTKIAEKYGVSILQLRKKNNLKTDCIRIGDLLKIR